MEIEVIDNCFKLIGFVRAIDLYETKITHAISDKTDYLSQLL